MHNNIFVIYNKYDEGMRKVCLRDFYIGCWESAE